MAVERVRVFAVLDGERVERDVPRVGLPMYLPKGWRLVGDPDDDPQAKPLRPSPTPRRGTSEGTD